MTSRKDQSGLTRQFMLLIATALLVSGLFFATLQHITNGLIEEYLNSAEYDEKESTRTIEKFQRYVSANNLSIADRQAFEQWAKKENDILLTISRNGILQFDSTYAPADEAAYGQEKVSQYHQTHALPVRFRDGQAQVRIDGFYSSRYFDLAFTLELLGATVIFLLIVLLGIRRSLKRLQRLHREIHILEGGELDYELTITGNDELTRIAESIDGLRKAFLDKLNAIGKLQQESRDLVTEISHDMRTPLTSLIMYLEFAKKERSEAQGGEQADYVNHAYRKALQLKTMSDHLFAYFLSDQEAEAESESESAAVNDVMKDLISDQIAVLRREHFRVRVSGELPESYIQVNREELGRVFDNLMSNLLKYADPAEEIRIVFASSPESFEMQTRNTIKQADGTTESSRLGERSMRRMMHRMQGQFESTQQNQEYLTLLKFRNTPI